MWEQRKEKDEEGEGVGGSKKGERWRTVVREGETEEKSEKKDRESRKEERE